MEAGTSWEQPLEWSLCNVILLAYHPKAASIVCNRCCCFRLVVAVIDQGILHCRVEALVCNLIKACKERSVERMVATIAR